MVLGGDPNKLNVAGYDFGDIIAADASGVLEPVAIGSSGEVLTVDPVQDQSVDWTPGGGGGGGTPSNTVVTEQAFGQAATAGIDSDYSRGDHTHGTPPAPSVPSASATVVTETTYGQASTAGVATDYSRGDHTHGTVATPTKSTVGLGNVDNTSDADKPVSTAQQAALDLKANLASPTFTGTVTLSGREVSTPDALTDGPTIAVDASLGNQFTVTLGDNRTLGNPTNSVNGQMILFAIRQDGAGNRTLTLDTNYRLGSDITSTTLSTGANKTDYLGVRYNATDSKWDVIAFVKGY